MHKFIGLMHLHSQAGCWSICRRCGEEWNDLWYWTFSRKHQKVIIAPKALEYME